MIHLSKNINKPMIPRYITNPCLKIGFTRNLKTPTHTNLAAKTYEISKKTRSAKQLLLATQTDHRVRSWQGRHNCPVIAHLEQYCNYTPEMGRFKARGDSIVEDLVILSTLKQNKNTYYKIKITTLCQPYITLHLANPWLSKLKLSLTTKMTDQSLSLIHI